MSTPEPSTPQPPSWVDTYNRAVAHLQAGRAAEALPLFKQVHEAVPGEYEPLAYLAETLGQLGDFGAARPLAEEATRRRPGDVEAWALLARAAKAQGDSTGAAGALARAADLSPGDPERWNALIEEHFRAGRFALALRATERALEHRPRALDLLAKQAACQTGLARVPEAIATLKAVVRGAPDGVDPAMGLANLYAYWHEATPAQVFEAHRVMAKVVERAARRGGGVSAGERERRKAGAPLRVGLLSPDFRRHSVAYFLRPILRHADRSRVQVVCLSTVQREDAETGALRTLAGEMNWRALGGLGQREIAERVAAEGLDVLVDLAGNTENNNLLALAMRPAPVTATYLGSPMTTGLKAVGHRIVDELTDPPPPAPADKLVTERLVRLERCFLCFEPPADNELPPPVREGGSGDGEPVVFGSFNALLKLNPACLRLWKRVLEAVPRSRLHLKVRGCEIADLHDELLARVRGAGLDMDRVSVAGTVRERAGHLAAYGGIDIALDTTPYCGTTTTCEAILMGVPVVSLVGQAHAARVGLSVLTALGRPEWAAGTEEEFVRVATRLVADRAGLRALRAGLRAQLLASPLCDGPGFARVFEGAMERIAASAAR